VTDGPTPAGARPAPGMLLPPPTPVGPHSTAGVAVMAHLRQQVDSLLRADAGLDDDAPDAVHQARVASRRLRSGLKVYGDLLVGGTSERLRSELSWYASRLSPSRDLEVFAEALEQGAADDLGDLDGTLLAETVVPWLRARRARLHEAALVDLRSPRADLVRCAREPRFVGRAARAAHKVLGPPVLEADRRAARRFEALGAHAPSDAWHLARIAAKRARYAAEVGAPALGRRCEELAVLWSEVTEPLGHAQDAVVQRGLVLERVADPAAPLSAGEAFTLGVFVSASHEREAAERRAARDVWRGSREQHHRLRKALG
jgi:CHAD domain-containing protein